MKISHEHAYLLQSVKKWFNRSEQVDYYSQEWDEGPTIAELHLLNALPVSGSVLDLGCGTGRISYYLAKQGYRVTGVDVSEALLSVASNKAVECKYDISFILADSLTLPFENETFDILIAFKLLCYIPTEKLRHQFLNELYRVLKPNGTCVMTQNIVPDDDRDEWDEQDASSPAANFQIVEKGDHFPSGIGFVHWFTENDLLHEFSNSLFEMELFQSDEEHQGAGLLRLIRLKKIR